MLLLSFRPRSRHISDLRNIGGIRGDDDGGYWHWWGGSLGGAGLGWGWLLWLAVGLLLLIFVSFLFVCLGWIFLLRGEVANWVPMWGRGNKKEKSPSNQWFVLGWWEK